jgi:hypothetical protein
MQKQKVEYTDGCMSPLKNYTTGGRISKFVCFSRIDEAGEKLYRVSFFPVANNLHHLEIANRGVFDDDLGWTVEGGGDVSFTQTKRNREALVIWGSKSLQESDNPVYPSDKEEADKILTMIKESCFSQ